MAFPRKVACFSASFQNVGQVDEVLRVAWNYEFSPGQFNIGQKQFLVGSECFLETPADGASMALVPDEQLLASVGMCAILAGEVLPLTAEFINALGEQSTANYQTIVGNVKFKVDPVAVVDANVGPLGTVFDLTFMRVGQSTNTKVVRADTWSICQYSNRIDSPAHSAPCVPGAIQKELAFKKSQLGSADSANRQAVIAFVASQLFWV